MMKIRDTFCIRHNLYSSPMNVKAFQNVVPQRGHYRFMAQFYERINAHGVNTT